MHRTVNITHSMVSSKAPGSLYSSLKAGITKLKNLSAASNIEGQGTCWRALNTETPMNYFDNLQLKVHNVSNIKSPHMMTI